MIGFGWLHWHRLLLVVTLTLGSAALPLTPWPVGAPSAAAAPIPAPATSQWPLTGAVRVIGGFDPPAQRWLAGHRGVDLAARHGQPVLAAAAGRVSYAARIAGRGVVVVDHGGVRTTYEPVEPLAAVGDRVHAGTVIGRIGNGGHCSNRCLHWGLKRGQTYLDPLRMIAGQSLLRLLPPDHRTRVIDHASLRTRDASVAGHRVSQFAAVPSGRGRLSHPVPGRITSSFGMRFHPIRKIWKLHDGTDFGAGCGTPIRAAAPGRVASVSRHTAYGNRLMLDHRIDGRRVRTGYNHAARYVVGTGTVVKRGQLIGYVGSTGYSTGCHLHLMLWVNGRLANPMSML